MAKKAAQNAKEKADKKTKSNKASQKKNSKTTQVKKVKKKTKETTKKTTKSKSKTVELNFDISQHVLVPKHELLSESEKEKVLKELGIELRQLPKIKVKDPAIRHLNAKPGDVVKITRKSPVAGEIIYYRSVIEWKIKEEF